MKAIDISRWQGDINWDAVKASGVEIAIIKMSGGDDGLYDDPKANANYYAAKKAGLAVGCYHFAGGTDPIAEADFFIKAITPLEENDVLVLDWEVANGNPPEWCRQFIQHVIDKTGTIPLIYMNTNAENSNDWSSVIALNVGLWIADYRYSPSATVPIRHWKTYVMHQYSSAGQVAGISGTVDLDEWFGSVDQFNKYGWHAPAPAPQAAPVPAPNPTPTPAPQPDLQAKLDAANAQVATLQAQVSDFTAKNVDLSNQLAQEQASHAKDVADLKQQLQDVQNKPAPATPPPAIVDKGVDTYTLGELLGAVWRKLRGVK